MRYTLVAFLLSLSVFAADYSNMFITSERPNPYSSEENVDDVKPKKQKKTVVASSQKKKKSPSLMKDSNIVYQMQFGFESESGYDDNGYGLVFSALKPMPKWSKKYKGLYVQGDILYTLKDLRNSTTQATKDYLAATAYVGYSYDSSERTAFSVRGGGSFVTGDNFQAAYGVGFKRKLINKSYKLVGDYLILGDMTFLSFGIEFSL